MKSFPLFLLVVTLFACSKNDDAASIKATVESHVWTQDSIVQIQNGIASTEYVTDPDFIRIQFSGTQYTAITSSGNIFKYYAFEKPDRLYTWYAGEQKDEHRYYKVLHVDDRYLVLQEIYSNRVSIYDYFHAQ